MVAYIISHPNCKNEQNRDNMIAVKLDNKGPEIMSGDLPQPIRWQLLNQFRNPTSTHGDYTYTTISHFNVIHFQCHQEAKRADTALKDPKKNIWEGATLRNNETLCNCIYERKNWTSLFTLEQPYNMICPSKPEPVCLLILNKARTQEDFISQSSKCPIN